MPHQTHNITRKIFRVFLYGFATVGVVFAGVFVAMRLHLTDVAGSIDSRNAYFTAVHKATTLVPNALAATTASQSFTLSAKTVCKIMTITSVLPNNGKMILDAYASSRSVETVERMIDAIILVTPSNTFLQDKLSKCDNLSNATSTNLATPSNQTIFDWVISPEWEVLRDAFVKNKDDIDRASRETGISSRMIVSSVLSEQFRFFTDNRESFKQYFEPLKLLGNATKFSYGVAGVKIETALQIENNLKNKNSPFYLGQNYEHMLDYTSVDVDAERLIRLTDTKSHYYSYLYTALYLKQIMHQWETAGYPISDRPEVLATLFNLGFVKSSPKENPEVGGSTIVIHDRAHTFGGLAYEFYYSGELSDIFPFVSTIN